MRYRAVVRSTSLPGGLRVPALLLFAILGACTGDCADEEARPCGGSCPSGSECRDGACQAVCSPPLADCNRELSDRCEVDTTDDRDNCGACGHSCWVEHAGFDCNGGQCVTGACDPGYADCDESPGCEQGIVGDVRHCGSCDGACPTGPHATPTCVGTQCGVSCDPGFADCDGDPATGCEAELAVDPQHCGRCETACPGGPHATAACNQACHLSCDQGFDDCDAEVGNGCEAELATDEAHCGLCGHPCALNEQCVAGACTPIACSAPQADCNHLAGDGCEVDTATDEAHCGMCGHACPAGSTCVAGGCTFGCEGQPTDPVTGQRCPIATPCTASPTCGPQSAATFQFWYCSTSLHTCQYLPQSGGFTAAAGTCTAQLTFRQLERAPWDKRIVPPDGVAFRTATTLALEVTNTTATDLYLDQLPLTLELAGTNPSRFDVAAVQLYQVGNIGDYGDGNNATIMVCQSPMTPFAGASTFTLGTGATGGCGASSFSRVRAGMSTRFLLNLAFSASASFIDGRQYRLRIAAPLSGVRARTALTGTSAAYTACTVPTAGFSGAYLMFRQP